MSVTDYLHPVRIWYLLKRDFNRKWKDYLITMGAAFGLFLLIFIKNAKTGTIHYDRHYGFISVMIFLLGLIFTSMAFREAHRKLLNHDWLMLPASTLEKFIEKLIMYTVLFPVVSIILYTLFTFISRFVVEVILGEFFPVFNPFDLEVLRIVKHYVIIQSVFVLGAAWFRSNNFIKTIITLVIISIVLTIFSAAIGWFVFKDYFWALIRNYDISMEMGAGSQLESFVMRMVSLLQFIYFVLLVPVCWFGSWLKLTEVEVKDGV